MIVQADSDRKNFDELVKSQQKDGFAKSSSCKARKN
jgi:hypothetical protein